jgi:hypothetical protein
LIQQNERHTVNSSCKGSNNTEKHDKIWQADRVHPFKKMLFEPGPGRSEESNRSMLEDHVGKT